MHFQSPLSAAVNGTLAGDFGFDPLNLGSDPKALSWWVAAKAPVHCFRVASIAGRCPLPACSPGCVHRSCNASTPVADPCSLQHPLHSNCAAAQPLRTCKRSY